MTRPASPVRPKGDPRRRSPAAAPSPADVGDGLHSRQRDRDAAAPASQTLDRGLRVLELVSSSPRPVSSAAIATHTGLHRSIAYRMLRTLEDHRLVTRDPQGRWMPGTGLALLAQRVVPHLRVAAHPVLEALAERTEMTAFLVVRDDGEAVTVVVVEPRSAQAHVTYRPGGRHPVTQGAPGLALLAGAPAVRGERGEVGLARERGWAFSESEVISGMKSCAAPVIDAAGTCVAAVAVIFVGDPELGPLGEQVVHAARELGNAL